MIRKFSSPTSPNPPNPPMTENLIMKTRSVRFAFPVVSDTRTVTEISARAEKPVSSLPLMVQSVPTPSDPMLEEYKQRKQNRQHRNRLPSIVPYTPSNNTRIVDRSWFYVDQQGNSQGGFTLHEIELLVEDGYILGGTLLIQQDQLTGKTRTVRMIEKDRDVRTVSGSSPVTKQVTETPNAPFRTEDQVISFLCDSLWRTVDEVGLGKILIRFKPNGVFEIEIESTESLDSISGKYCVGLTVPANKGASEREHPPQIVLCSPEIPQTILFPSSNGISKQLHNESDNELFAFSCY